MTTKDEALKKALEALEFSKSYLDDLADVHGTSKKAKPGSTAWNVDSAIAACREALAQKDEQALHAGAAVPSEAISLSGDAKLAHDQCRAVVQLASSFAEVYAARAAIVAHDAKLSDLIGDASASAMEWLGDELNAMEGITEDDLWLDPIFEAAQKRWPQQPPRRPQKDEQEPDYKALWKQMCERCDYLDKIAHELQTLCDVQALRLGEHENRKPLTDEQIEKIWDSTLSEDVGITALRKITRAIEAAHGIGVEHDAQL